MTAAGNQEKYQKSTKLENESTLSRGGQGACYYLFSASFISLLAYFISSGIVLNEFRATSNAM